MRLNRPHILVVNGEEPQQLFQDVGIAVSEEGIEQRGDFWMVSVLSPEREQGSAVLVGDADPGNGRGAVAQALRTNQLEGVCSPHRPPAVPALGNNHQAWRMISGLHRHVFQGFADPP